MLGLERTFCGRLLRRVIGRSAFFSASRFVKEGKRRRGRDFNDETFAPSSLDGVRGL